MKNLDSICNPTILYQGSTVIANAKTKIALLDDDHAFTEAASYYLDKKFGNSVTISAFSSSVRFLEHIHNYCYLPESIYELISNFYSGSKSKKDAEQVLRDLSVLPAILIVDHQLRDEAINGVKVSHLVKDYIPTSFIIMLTSTMDINGALNLHNNEIIDLYIRKDDEAPLESICSHLEKKISKLNESAYMNPEDAFGFETILENELYISKRSELLNEILFKSYLTLTSDGEIAVLDLNDHIRYYRYEGGAFYLHE